MVRKAIVLVIGGLLSTNIQALQDTKERHRHIVKGRVVNQRGQPVSSAIVVLAPRTSVEHWESLIIFHTTTSDGRFSIEEDDVDANRAYVLYVTGEMPADAELPVTPPFAGLATNNPAFLGRGIALSESDEIDIGDVPVQLSYGLVFIYHQDRGGKTLTFDPDNTTLISEIKLRVRDMRGDVVSESWVSERAFHYAESAVAVALPEGQWQLEFGQRSKGDAVIWHRLPYPLTIRVTGSPLKVSVRMSANDREFADRPILPAYDPKFARRKLKDMGIEFSKEAFLERVERQNTDAAMLFLLSGMDPDSVGKQGSTALMLAAGLGAIDIVRVLIREQADVNARNDFGVTCVMLAAASFREDIVALLLDSGAQINDQANDGRTALMMAVANGQTPNVKLLLAAGADVNLKDKSGKSAIQIASELGRTELAELLNRFARR